MEQPLVSIIIPIYNAENTLRKCLGRVRNQTYENIEVLMVDDGSTDHSSEICQEYCTADPRFRLLRQAHQGVAAGRNRAMAEAQGTYLQFCDSDDWLSLIHIYTAPWPSDTRTKAPYQLQASISLTTSCSILTPCHN